MLMIESHQMFKVENAFYFKFQYGMIISGAIPHLSRYTSNYNFTI